jgi:hypothetical protein
VANFVRNTLKPPKPLCKRFFAVLQKDSFDQHISMFICKIVSDNDDTNLDSDSGMTGEELKSHNEWKVEMRARIRNAGNSIVCKSSTDDSEFEVQIEEFPVDYAAEFYAGGNRHEWEWGLL